MKLLLIFAMIFALSSTISARALDAKIKENESNETTTTVKRDDMDDFIFEEATTKSQNPDYDQIAAVSVEEGKSKLPEADQIAAVSVEEEKKPTSRSRPDSCSFS